MAVKKNITITKNKYKNNYQQFDTIDFSQRQRYYDNVMPHWHDFFELEIIVGKGSTTLDDTTYTFEEGCMSLIPPASIHSYKFEQDMFFCYNFNFDIKYLNSDDLSTLISEAKSIFLPLSKADIEWYSRLFDNFSDAFNKSSPFSRLYCLKILEFLLMDIQKYGNKSNHLQTAYVQSSSAIQKAILYIQKHFRKDIRMKDVANYVFLSEKYFSHLFHQEVGCKYSEYLTNIRLKNACHMLIHANDPVIEIAKDSGFNDSKHFQRTFKKHYGITPIEYRKRNR